MDRLCRSLIAVPSVLGWLGGLLPVRNPLIVWKQAQALTPEERPIAVLPHFHIYTLYALLVNLLNIGLFLDTVLYGLPQLPPSVTPPRMTLKEVFFHVYEYAVTFVNFGTRFYFVYKARAMLRLFQQIQRHASRMRAWRDESVSCSSVFRLPIPVILLFFVHFSVRATFQTAQVIRAVGNEYYFGAGGNSYLGAITGGGGNGGCPECRAVLYIFFAALPYFITAVVPWEFGLLLLVPLVNIFREFYERVTVTAAGADGQAYEAAAAQNPRATFTKAARLGVAPAFVHGGNGVDPGMPPDFVQGAGAAWAAAVASTSKQKDLVAQFEEIQSYFDAYGRIFGPKLSMLFVLSITSGINNFASLRENPGFYQAIIIAWEVAVLAFNEVGCWAHASIENCQAKLQKMLVLPDGLGRRAGGGRGAPGAGTAATTTSEDRETVARLICAWNWRLRAGRGFFVIDRSLYASILTFVLSYSIMLFQIDAASKKTETGPPLENDL